MSKEKKQQMRITSEQAFHAVGEALEKLNLRIDNHTEQLKNQMEIIAAQQTLIDALISDVKRLRDVLMPGPVN